MWDQYRPITLTIAALIAVSLGGCNQASLKQVWLADDMVHLTDRTEAPVQGESLELFSASNETVGFQLVIDAGPLTCHNLTIKLDSLESPEGRKIDAANIQAFRMIAIPISSFPSWYLRLMDVPPQPAGYYDALVPIAPDKSLRVDANQRLAIWVDLKVPRFALPGDYSGSVSVLLDDKTVWTGKLGLTVYDFVLPDQRPVLAIGGFDYRTLFAEFIRFDGRPYVPVHLDRRRPLVRSGLKIMRQLMQLAHDHRIDLFETAMCPVLKRDRFGDARMDWENYDAIVMPYLTGSAFSDRVGCPAWPIPVRDDWPDPADYGGVNSPEYASTFIDAIADCKRHFAHRPGIAGQVFAWPERSAPDSDAYRRYGHLARMVRNADPQVPLLSTLPVKPPKLTGWNVPDGFAKLVDIHAPPAEWLDPRADHSQTQSDHPLAGLWLSPGKVPYLPSLGILAAPADIRAFAWFAMKYNCKGLLLTDVLNWQSEATMRTNGAVQTSLFYPGSIAGRDEVLPSIRLKRLRRGLQDAAYIHLLRSRGKLANATAILNAMVRYAGLDSAGDNYLDPRLDGWVKDPRTWRLARKILATDVQAAVHPEALGPLTPLDEHLTWQEFDITTHSLRLDQIRSRVTGPSVPAADGANPPLQATIMLELFNEYSTHVELDAGIDSLPEGWVAVQASQHIRAIPPAARQLVTLSAQGSYAPTDSNGKFTLPVTVTSVPGVSTTIQAEVAFVRAGRLNRQIIIDGSLDDWPMRAGNTAGQFKLIGRRGRRNGGLANRQTRVFVLHDDRNLYFAFRCKEPRLDMLMAKATNFVQYEQLLATGEDMVEIIFDPGAVAAGADELYHLIVKANGSIITERGIQSDPPLGEVTPWPARARAAVGSQEGVWIVELAIPLDSFGPAANVPFWGVNFARFATQGDEASSWSGASRHFYDPRLLGTLYLPLGR